MKTWDVETHITEYYSYTVEAKTKKEATKKAAEKLPAYPLDFETTYNNIVEIKNEV